MELEQHLLRDIGRAVVEHSLIADGDKIMVGVSGGKDSYALLQLLRIVQQRAPVDFELIAVHVDQGHPGYDGKPLVDWLEREGHRYEIVRQDTYSIVTEKIAEGKTYCSLCSRLRRGILYKLATRLGCNKIALGHHREDVLETLLLNLFFGGKLATMPAKFTNDSGEHIVIRPLVYAAESNLEKYAVEHAFPILPCNLCGSQSQAQRKQMKAMLSRMEVDHPKLKQTMLAAIGNVNPSHLLDRELNRRLGASEPRGSDTTLDEITDVLASPAAPESSASDRRRLPISIS